MIKTKFWIFCFLVLVVVGANFFFTSQRLHSGVSANADARLTWSHSRAGLYEGVAAGATIDAASAAVSRAEVRDAAVSAARAESPPDSAAFRRIMDTLGEGAAQTEGPRYRLVILATHYGASVFHVERPMEVNLSLPEIPALQAALRGEADVGLFLDDGELLRVAAAPIGVQPEVRGALLLGYPIDEAYAKGVSEATGVDATLIVDGAIVASTVPAEGRSGLSSAARAAAPGSLFGFTKSSTGVTAMTSAVTGVEAVYGHGRAIKLGGMDSATLVLSTRSQQHFAALEEYQTFQLIVMGALLLLGLVWAFFVAQSASSPVRRMASQVSRAASGDLKTRLEVSSFKGEMKRLAELVNGVLDQAERKGATLPASVLGKKEPDIASLLPETTPEPEEPAADAFDFGFGQPSEPAAPPAQEPAQPAAEEHVMEAPAAPPAVQPAAGLDELVASGEAPLFPSLAPVPPQAIIEEMPPPPSVTPLPEQPEPPPPPPEAPAADLFSDLAQPTAAPAPDVGAADEFGPDDGMSPPAHPADPVMPPMHAPGPSAPPMAFDPAMMGAAAAKMQADPFASALSDFGGEMEDDDADGPAATVVQKVPDALLQATARARASATAPPAQPASSGADPDDPHFREVYKSFVETRKQCGESADGLTFDKFVVKLRKNRETIREKYGARSVRFQVYVKDGKAALKATPVR